MKKQLFILLLVLAWLMACTSNRLVTPRTEKFLFTEINNIAKNREGLITFMNGEEYDGFDIHITSDSTTWKDSTKTRSYNFSTDEIRQITFIAKGKGALQGLGYGTLIGAGGALILGVITTEGGEEFSATDSAAILAVFVGAPAGAIIGLVYGSSHGSKTIYTINNHFDKTQMENH